MHAGNQGESHEDAATGYRLHSRNGFCVASLRPSLLPEQHLARPLLRLCHLRRIRPLRNANPISAPNLPTLPASPPRIWIFDLEPVVFRRSREPNDARSTPVAKRRAAAVVADLALHCRSLLRS